MLKIKYIKYLIILGLSASLILLSGCGKKTPDNVIKVGTVAGPETQLMEVAKEVVEKKYGSNIQIVQFTDYVIPNEALADGSIDANVFQTLPYLENAIKEKNYKLTSIGKTFIYPIGIYSKKINKLADVKVGAIVAIDNDPSNETRALLLLEKAGLIQLKPNVGFKASILDIIKNPKNLQIKELDAAQLPRVLPDVDLAVINTNYAVSANLFPSRDALFLESSNSPYANLIVVRSADKDNPKFKPLIEALHSKEVHIEANKLFQGQSIAAWQ